ncbi:MAG TPA: hypothetical protein VE961_16165 [Pyrinomonadaceae bacterium]|nr:hypothetical protein [Pyrinomonadaceae bacterium]
MRSQLKHLAANPKLISGIYNYCDRWCERCAFTSRCLVFATLEADATTDELASHDLQSAAFWEKLADVFEETRVMIMEWADQQGIDLSQVQIDLSLEDREERLANAKHDQIVLAAKSYALRTFEFFDHPTPNSRSIAIENENTEDEVASAIDVIQHYQFFITAKIFRALMARGITIESDELAGQFETEAFDAVSSDGDGSAKIALIAIDRSQSAWQVLRRHLPQETKTIKSFIVELEQLKQTVEETFTKARDFMRPGFDVIVSEFDN